MPKLYAPEEKYAHAIALGIRVDPEDVWLLYAYRWYIAAQRYVMTHVPGENNQTMMLHHCIVGMPWSRSIVIDHIDRDTLHNCRINLRYIHQSENVMNSVRSDSTTHIYFRDDCNKYAVRLVRMQQRYYGGTYGTLDEAIVARDALLKSIREI
jgi:hypothetical protein